MTTTVSSAARSTGSERCRSRRKGRSSASASARRCARAISVVASYKHPQGQAEIGYYPIRPTPAGLAVVNRLAGAGLSMAPRGLRAAARARELLAEGDMFEVQAFRYGRTLRAAISSGRDPRHDAPLDHARPRRAWKCRAQSRAPRTFADREVYDYSARAWLGVFLERWIGVAA